MNTTSRPYGFLLVDKPVGITSREAVAEVERRLRELGCAAAVGHCGTLDPLATGLMVLAIGPATRLTPWLQSGSKRYRAVFQMGVTSESLDLETPLTDAQPSERPLQDSVEKACHRFTGRISQVPPKYSALRVQGKRAYELAREGKEFQLPPREVTIHELNLLRYDWPWLEIDVLCSGGTYIRSLGDDLAQAVGTRAVMTELKRTGASGFQLEQAWTWNEIMMSSAWSRELIDAATGLRDMPRLVIDSDMSQRFSNGLISHELDAQLESLRQQTLTNLNAGPTAEIGKEVLLLLPDQGLVGIAYRRSKPNHEDAWRIKLSLVRWLEPKLV